MQVGEKMFCRKFSVQCLLVLFEFVILLSNPMSKPRQVKAFLLGCSEGLFLSGASMMWGSMGANMLFCGGAPDVRNSIFVLHKVGLCAIISHGVSGFCWEADPDHFYSVGIQHFEKKMKKCLVLFGKKSLTLQPKN